ncbi:MAG: (2Fe-2S)-binding protein [Candidatus Thermoplasmatota archaeon]|nr:(2Fe-2S)-binding protein [Candidatus Thermoplasmatota archaeon]MBS3789512.1 (2Fe-2S)-binding protein [Candidatus Thermoplasmatota archaeon]
MTTVVCRCEDLTEEDIVEAIEEGYDELETLKRHLRLGMGPCQGKACLLLARRILRRETGKDVEEMKEPTARPPSRPVPFSLLASPDEGGEDDD